MTRPASGTGNYMDSVSTQNSEIIFCQSYLTWDTNSISEDLVGIGITSATISGLSYDTPYSAKIMSRSAV